MLLLKAAALGHSLIIRAQGEEERWVESSSRINELEARLAKAAKACELKLENEWLRGELAKLRGYHADYESRMEGELAHFQCVVEGAESRAAEADMIRQTLELHLAARHEEWVIRGLVIEQLEAKARELAAQAQLKDDVLA